MSIKLYHGTTETIAKSAPMLGIKLNSIELTTCYAAYQAFNVCDPKKRERWAVVEITLNRLVEDLFVSSKSKTWQKSLELTGFCTYLSNIPPNAIGKVWVFNPESNYLITRAVIHSNTDYYKTQKKSLGVINRWLTGEFMMIDEWLSEQKEEFTKEQKTHISNLWNERSGLDLFYHGPKIDR